MWPQPNIHDLLEQLRRCHPQEIDLSLDRMVRLLDLLNHPERNLPPVIHVAGTNGKGSTIAFMESMLRRGGYKVHVYTSPHLIRYNERVRLSGQLIADDLFHHYLTQVLKKNNGSPLTVFEGITAAALLAFSDHPADILLLEVGLGGRADATNVIDKPLLSMITPISLDHQEYLGTKITDIAKEKAGIIKRGCPVTIGLQSSQVDVVLRRKVQECASSAFFLKDYQEVVSSMDGYSLGLKGPHQRENAALAWLSLDQVHQQFPIGHKKRVLALAETAWPGRMHQITQGPLIHNLSQGTELWVDGAHNEAGIKSLIPFLEMWRREGRPVVVGINSLANRPASQFAGWLKPYVDQWFFIDKSDDYRFHNQENFTLAFHQVTSLENLIDNLSNWANDSRILITGSLYLVGEVLRLNQTFSHNHGGNRG